MANSKQLRILCLHGYKQYDTQFKNRTNALRKSLKSLDIEWKYITAPHKIPFDVHLKQQKALENKMKNNDEAKQIEMSKDDKKIKDVEYLPNARCWWRSTQDGTKYNGIEESLKYIAHVIKDNGSFDGILGFSQGGVLSVILCLIKKYPLYFEKEFNLSSDTIQQASNFKFVWIVSGFLPRCNELKPLLADILSDTQDKSKLIDDIPLLLVYGTQDEYISTENVLNITKIFNPNNISIVEHDGGHYIAAKATEKQKYLAFLSKI